MKREKRERKNGEKKGVLLRIFKECDLKVDLTAYGQTGYDRPYRKLQTMTLDPTAFKSGYFSIP